MAGQGKQQQFQVPPHQLQVSVSAREGKAMALTKTNPNTALTPVHWFSHGSTMVLGEESAFATYWKKCGDEALANGIKGVIIMVSWSNRRHTLSPLSSQCLPCGRGRTPVTNEQDD